MLIVGVDEGEPYAVVVEEEVEVEVWVVDEVEVVIYHPITWRVTWAEVSVCRYLQVDRQDHQDHQDSQVLGPQVVDQVARHPRTPHIVINTKLLMTNSRESIHMTVNCF